MDLWEPVVKTQSLVDCKISWFQSLLSQKNILWTAYEVQNCHVSKTAAANCIIITMLRVLIGILNLVQSLHSGLFYLVSSYLQHN